MAMQKRNVVTIVVDRKYFENVFEPGRRKLQQKLGLNNLTQPKFTAIIAQEKLLTRGKIKTKPLGFSKWY